jgi:VIT1/CCC1 family predicted Fe2+/Mn2+ transporter
MAQPHLAALHTVFTAEDWSGRRRHRPRDCLTAGAVSMALGEYVSVSSQRDAARDQLARERRELNEDPEAELVELAGCTRRRG